MLQRGDLMPMFTVTDLRDGTRAAYDTIWQHRELVLVSTPQHDATGAAYVASVVASAPALQTREARLVITADPIPGMPAPGVLVADQWGEIHYVQGEDSAAALPPPTELVDWLHFVQMQCPECQGETR